MIADKAITTKHFRYEVSTTEMHIILYSPQILRHKIQHLYINLVYSLNFYFYLDTIVKYIDRSLNHYFVLRNRRYVFIINYFLLLRASTPGSTFPSRSSRLAPPPVLTWESLSSAWYSNRMKQINMSKNFRYF